MATSSDTTGLLVCPVGKTSAPVLADTVPYIPRSRPSLEIPSHARSLILAASPGYGKTYFAAQLFHRSEGPKLWYTLDEEDNDAMLFCRRFAGAASRELNADVTELSSLLTATSPPELARLRDLLADSINALGPVTLVFDDEHKLDQDSASSIALRQLPNLLSPESRVIVAGRHVGTRPLGSGVVLTDKDLAFSPEESLAASPPDITSDAVLDIHSACRGWPAVVCDTYRAIKGRDAPDISAECSRVLDTALEEVLKGVIDDMPALLTLAPSAVTFDFAKDLVGEESWDGLRTTMRGLGEFVDLQDKIRFDPRLQRYLLRRLKASEDAERVTDRHIDEARRHGDWLNVFELLADRADLPALEILLAEHITDVINQIDPNAPKSPISDLRHEDLSGFPYLALFVSRTEMEQSPVRAHDFLIAARDGFRDAGDERGELLALIYRWALQMNFALGMGLVEEVPRMGELIERFGASLTPMDRTTLDLQMAAHIVFNVGDSESARQVLDRIAVAAKQNDLPNELARCESYRAIDHIFHHRAEEALEVIERFSKIDSSRLSETTRILTASVQTNWFNLTGRRANFYAQVDDIFSDFKADLLEQGQACGLLYMWLIDFSIIEGDYEEAARLLNRSRDIFTFMVEGEWQNQHRWRSAFIEALTGNHDAARTQLDAIQTFSNSTTYELRQRLTMASTLTELGEFSDALRLLQPVLDASDYPHFSTVAHGIAYKCYHAMEDRDRADVELAAWVKGITSRRPRIQSVGYSRSLLLELIQTAGQIAPDDSGLRQTCEQICEQTLRVSLDENYDIIDVLRVRSGPNLQFSIGDITLDLTRLQRKLLVLLAFAPDHRVPVERLKTALWVDVEDAESRFHQSMTRLRKVFSSHGLEPRNYLAQRGGYLQLSHVETDIGEFESQNALANYHYRRGHNWLAAAAGFAAIDAWPGAFDPEIDAAESLSSQVAHLQLMYRQLCTRLAAEAGSPTKASRLAPHLERLFTGDPSDPEVAHALVALYRTRGDIGSIIRTRAAYRASLEQLDLPEEQVNLLVLQLG